MKLPRDFDINNEEHICILASYINLNIDGVPTMRRADAVRNEVYRMISGLVSFRHYADSSIFPELKALDREEIKMCCKNILCLADLLDLENSIDLKYLRDEDGGDHCVIISTDIAKHLKEIDKASESDENE